MSSASPPLSRTSRNALVVGGVVLVHGALLWGLQHAPMRRAAEVVIPVELLSDMLTPPRVEPAAAPPPHPAPVPSRPAPKLERTRPPPAPKPLPVRPEPPPAPATAAPAEPQPTPALTLPPAAAPAPAPVQAAAPAPSPAPAPAPKVELPISDADYLQNPPPAWPRLSQRLGEKGLVVVRALIGTDGRAREAHIARSSGYDRLDNASLAAVLAWRYVPGKRGGVPQEMWVDVPIRWGS